VGKGVGAPGVAGTIEHPQRLIGDLVRESLKNGGSSHISENHLFFVEIG